MRKFVRWLRSTTATQKVPAFVHARATRSASEADGDAGAAGRLVLVLEELDQDEYEQFDDYLEVRARARGGR